ncbi:hypothetical protein VB780_09180 [Leptolyngbya sp. CCNP1308]|uniref:hypothetical protein n=1 Tax=Leptolyngbya sp. CCNP1308 TaxID=3110255 RepID=UPI002B201744|nr:hypothetical protein [Leptolyngbya sp. CCNP1308]MEA5448737.1 hypothetical protein [Leptolyngbya sp. CCNP1308]
MGRKRVRYQWFRDIPRNVTYREYEQFQMRSFGAFSLGLTAAAMAIVSGLGLTLRPAQELTEFDAISIAAAIEAGSDRPDPVKLEGYLVAANPPTMPDDAARRVIRGRLQIAARGPADSEEPLRETLFLWEETAAPVFLSDGDRRIPLAFDLAVLPMEDEDASQPVPRIVWQGDSARTSRPVAIEYGDQVFPLDREVWGSAESVYIDLERQVIPQGQAVVVIAKVEATPQGNQLADPLGDRLQVVFGTEDEFRQQGQQLRLWFGLLSIPLGLASVMVGRSAYGLWQEFVERSHQ